MILLLEEKARIPKLVLAGRKGWKIEKLLNGIDEKVVSNIVFTGFIEDEDLGMVYTCAKGFIFPSIYEGFGIPPLEAMACNTVVVSSDATSLPEVLGEAAIYFSSDDKEDLKRKICLLCLLNDDERNKYINLGKKQVKYFNWQHEAESLLSMLKRARR